MGMWVAECMGDLCESVPERIGARISPLFSSSCWEIHSLWQVNFERKQPLSKFMVRPHSLQLPLLVPFLS